MLRTLSTTPARAAIQRLAKRANTRTVSKTTNCPTGMVGASPCWLPLPPPVPPTKAGTMAARPLSRPASAQIRTVTTVTLTPSVEAR